jgi:hypothetical protein
MTTWRRLLVAAVGISAGAAGGWLVGAALGFHHVLPAALTGAATPVALWLYRSGRATPGRKAVPFRH